MNTNHRSMDEIIQELVTCRQSEEAPSSALLSSAAASSMLCIHSENTDINAVVVIGLTAGITKMLVELIDLLAEKALVKGIFFEAEDILNIACVDVRSESSSQQNFDNFSAEDIEENDSCILDADTARKILEEMEAMPYPRGWAEIINAEVSGTGVNISFIGKHSLDTQLSLYLSKNVLKAWADASPGDSLSQLAFQSIQTHKETKSPKIG